MTRIASRRLALAAASAALLGLSAPVALAQGQPIKIGMMTIDSGPFATHAAVMAEGARAAVKMLNAEGGVLGRKFELVIQAHSGSPATALAAASKLVQQSGASLLIGQTTSSITLALAPKLADMNVLFIDHYAQTNEMLGKGCVPNYFRVNTPDAVITKIMSEYVKSLGAKSWNMISPDYASGYSFSKAFTEMVGGMGASVQQSLFAPTGTNDFGSYISQLSKPADALMVTLYMSDGQSFAKQQKQFGLFSKYKAVVGNGFATDFQLDAHGDNVLGVVNALSWLPSLPGKRNAEYVKAFVLENKRMPFYTDADIMAALEVYKSGIAAAKSTDTAAVRKALEGLKVSTIFGDSEVRAADHHLVRQHTMSQVVRKKGGEGVAFEMKYTKPGSELYPAPNPECKVR